jgi:hypothetical protein
MGRRAMDPTAAPQIVFQDDDARLVRHLARSRAGGA